MWQPFYGSSDDEDDFDNERNDWRSISMHKNPRKLVGPSGSCIQIAEYSAHSANPWP